MLDAEEAAAADAGPNRLSGRLLETTYLGEIAQHIVELPGRTRVKIAELNPRHGVAQDQAGAPVTVGVDAEDVVLLPSV